MCPLRFTRWVAVPSIVLLALGWPPAVGSAVPSADVVLAEAYGGGGNSGAQLTTDFIELGNRGSAPVSLTGWSVQYLPAAPTASSRWQATPLGGSVAPGGRFLIAEARGAGGSMELPTPDATGTIAMAAGAGTVALVDGTAPLTCLTVADCAADGRIRDLVGYGAAAVREGSPAPAASNTTSVARSTTLVDSDSNAADFVAGVPSPANTAGQGGEQPPTEPGTVRIHDVQGATRLSPVSGQRIAAVPGVVTAVRSFGSSRGFWFQDPVPDGDERTSEAMFVFTGAVTPALAPGDGVVVSGTVVEFRPGDPANQTITQLAGATWSVVTRENPLPAALPLAPDTVPAAFSAEPGGDIEALPLEPGRYALDFYESVESMRISASEARVVGPTTEFNELWITSKPGQNPSPRGGTVYGSYADPNSGRLKVESLVPFAQQPFPQVDVGAVMPRVEGVMDYDSFGGYTLLATVLGTPTGSAPGREVTAAGGRSTLEIATYNVENLSPLDPQAKFDRLAAGIATNLAGPDIVTLEEIQDNSGPTPDGTVAADQTLARFVEAIVAAGGPRYEWRQIDPRDGTDGGQPGGNIRVAFLFDPTEVSFVDRPGGDATTAVEPRLEHGHAALSISPGRLDPGNPAWTDSRKPLVGEFLFPAGAPGRRVFVVANHFRSKGGDQPLHGRFQPANRSSEGQRIEQARVVRQFVDALYDVDPHADIVVAGDLNDFQFSPSVQTLTAGGALRNPLDTLPPGERYSYVFEGNAQVLDHILLGRNIGRTGYDIVHINAEYADQASDHDPQVVTIRP